MDYALSYIYIYCFNTSNQEIKKQKVLRKSYSKRHKNGRIYKSSFDKEIIYKKMNNIQNPNHQLFTNEMNKIALSYNEDKLYIFNDNMYSYISTQAL